jgi:hypothetical protein
MTEINGNVTISLEDYKSLTELAEYGKKVVDLELEKQWLIAENKRLYDLKSNYDNQCRESNMSFDSGRIFIITEKEKLKTKEIELEQREKKIDYIENNKLKFIFGLINK